MAPRALTALAIFGVLLVVGGSLAYYYECVYVPPPSTYTENSQCQATSPSQVVISGSWVINVTTSAPATLNARSCSFVTTKIVTPMRCGVMCGGNLGETVYYGVSWTLNFSLTLPSNDSVPVSLMVSSNALDNGVFMSQGLDRIYVNSQEVTWYSNPPCGSSASEGTDCYNPGASSITVEPPGSIQSGDFQLVTNSSYELVP